MNKFYIPTRLIFSAAQGEFLSRQLFPLSCKRYRMWQCSSAKYAQIQTRRSTSGDAPSYSRAHKGRFGWVSSLIWCYHRDSRASKQKHTWKCSCELLYRLFWHRQCARKQGRVESRTSYTPAFCVFMFSKIGLCTCGLGFSLTLQNNKFSNYWLMNYKN